MKQFQLINQYPTKHEYAGCRNDNRPMAYILKRHGEYTYLVMDFTTCDYSLSPAGQTDVQKRLNNVLFDYWHEGRFTFKLNNTCITQTYSVLRLNDVIIEQLLDYMNQQTEKEWYWISDKQRLDLQDTRRLNYESGVIHPKNNRNAICVLNENVIGEDERHEHTDKVI